MLGGHRGVAIFDELCENSPLLLVLKGVHVRSAQALLATTLQLRTWADQQTTGENLLFNFTGYGQDCAFPNG